MILLIERVSRVNVPRMAENVLQLVGGEACSLSDAGSKPAQRRNMFAVPFRDVDERDRKCSKRSAGAPRPRETLP